MAMTSATATETLHGTPVVPGVAFAPALVVRGEVSAEAIERFGDGGFVDADAAMAAFDSAAEAVAASFTAKADKASGAAHEVLTASAGLARDKGLRGAVATSVNGGSELSRSYIPSSARASAWSTSWTSKVSAS